MSKEILLKYIDKYSNDKVLKNIPSSFWSLSNLLEEMYNQAIGIKAKTIVEIGVDTGSSSIALLCATKENDGNVYSIDIAACGKAKQNVKEFGLEENWVFTQMDSVEAGRVWATEIDLLFIDTDHTYDSTTKEMETWIPWVRNGGIILFHDVHSRKDEVQKAIDDYLIKYQNQFEYSIYDKSSGILPDPYGLGIMKKL